MPLVAALRRVRGRLDVVHYTTAINHAGKGEGGENRARALLAWMGEDGVKPNDVTYTSLIHILGQVRTFRGCFFVCVRHMCEIWMCVRMCILCETCVIYAYDMLYTQHMYPSHIRNTPTPNRSAT